MAGFFFYIVVGVMKRIFILLVIAVSMIGLIALKLKSSKKVVLQDNVQIQQEPVQTNTAQNSADLSNSPAINTVTAGLALPVARAKDRITKKPFGIYITSKNSPVQPERFSGYHTGTDFETFPEEQNSDVPVYAITSGKIILEKWASGYGGVLVESAEINGQPVTIIYGHINLASINKKTGDSLSAGEQIGFLGKGYSQETDGERKHLHLGIHKGSAVSILGYVQNKNDLGQWIDLLSIFNF